MLFGRSSDNYDGLMGESSSIFFGLSYSPSTSSLTELNYCYWILNLAILDYYFLSLDPLF